MATKIELLTEVQRAINEEEGQIKRLMSRVKGGAFKMSGDSGPSLEDRFEYYFDGLKFCDDLIQEFKQDLIKERSRDL